MAGQSNSLTLPAADLLSGTALTQLSGIVLAKNEAIQSADATYVA